ncbi:MAG: acyltransferase [Flavobacteriia bacterium]|nr:acyltransferase [Flavobacteriia bacterium]
MDKGRVFGLDVLRALAILFVILAHGSALLGDSAMGSFIRTISLDGVSIFFVLSGFLIGKILIRTLDSGQSSTAALFNFWKRRWFRTLPNYFLVLFILLAYYFYMGRKDWSGIWHFFTFTQNFALPHPPFFQEAWSLSVEEWFYLLVPFVLWILVGALKLPVKWTVPVVALTVIYLSTDIRVAIFNMSEMTAGEPGQLHLWDIYIRKTVVTRLDSIMFGVIGAWLATYFANSWRRFKTPLFILGVLMLILHRWLFFQKMDNINTYMVVYSFTLMSLGTLFLLPFLSEWRSSNSRLSRFFTWTSILSYSMYLLHFSLILNILIRRSSIVEMNSGIQFIIFIALTYGLSFLLYHSYEKRMTRLRDKF